MAGGQVENQVKTSRDAFFKPIIRGADLDEINALLAERTLNYAKKTRHPEFKDRTIWEVFEEERAALIVFQGPFRGFHETTAAVSKTCLVSFDRNRYSVEARAVGRPVQVQAYATKIVILQNGAVVGEHARAFGRDGTIYDPWHYVPVLERKPGALRNGAPFKEMTLPPAMAKVQERLSRAPDGSRQMVAILLAAHDKGLDVVEAACAEALEAGLRSADAILNILSRQDHPALAAPIEPPRHLRLREEPIADCARYGTPSLFCCAKNDGNPYDRLSREVGHGAA